MGGVRFLAYKNGMARALYILLTQKGDYFSTNRSRRSRTVSTDASAKRELRGLKGTKGP